MGSENQDGEQPSEFTVVVNIKIKPGFEKDYDEWLKHFLAVLEESTWLPRNNNDHGNKQRFNCEAYNSQV